MVLQRERERLICAGLRHCAYRISPIPRLQRLSTPRVSYACATSPTHGCEAGNEDKPPCRGRGERGRAAARCKTNTDPRCCAQKTRCQAADPYGSRDRRFGNIPVARSIDTLPCWFERHKLYPATNTSRARCRLVAANSGCVNAAAVVASKTRGVGTPTARQPDVRPAFFTPSLTLGEEENEGF